MARLRKRIETRHDLRPMRGSVLDRITDSGVQKSGAAVCRRVVAVLVAWLLLLSGTPWAAEASADEVAGLLRVKITRAAAAVASLGTARTVGTHHLGVESLDALSEEAGVQSIRASSFEPRHVDLDESIGISRWLTVHLPRQADLGYWSARFVDDPNVERVSLVYRGEDESAPSDPYYPDQWGHNNTGQFHSWSTDCSGHCGPQVGTPGFDAGLEIAWEAAGGYGDPDVIIAIIDFRGVQIHPDLRLVSGWDFTGNDADPSPTGTTGADAHGTSCAGIAAAITDNGIGVAGVAGGCSVMPLKTGNSAQVAQALVFAADNGAFTASMSFSYTLGVSIPDLEDALEYAYQAGVLLVSGVGNNNRGSFGLPQSHSRVIAAAAASPCGERKRSSDDPAFVNPNNFPDANGVSCDNERWWGANWGVDVQDAPDATDLLAPTIMPAPDLLGADGATSGDYTWLNGSSCASPYVAGVAALIKSAHPDWTVDEVWQRMTATATDVVNVESGVGWDMYSGYGMVNAANALTSSTAVAPEPVGRTRLGNATPNPFNPHTTIRFELEHATYATLDVFDLAGRQVATLVNEHRDSGLHSVVWNGRDVNGHPVASGVYLYRLQAGEFEQTRRMVLLK